MAMLHCVTRQKNISNPDIHSYIIISSGFYTERKNCFCGKE